MTKFDSIILGGGLSGLSLALSLKDQSILILEGRKEYKADRTFCFWNVQPHPFEHLVQYKWSEWQVQLGGECIALNKSPFEYHCLPSKVFYDEAMTELAKRNHVTLLLDVRVDEVIEEDEHVVVKHSQGVAHGLKVYNSLPLKEKAPLYQHFLGWHLKTQDPFFNPKAITLMDFDVAQDDGLNFMYTLPFSQTHGLIESTFISPSPHPKDYYVKLIQRYLKSRSGLNSFEIISQERGVLPLRTKSPQATKRVIPIGARGGWMRASTGYAFLSTQKQVQNLIKKGKADQESFIQKKLDKIFLSYIKEYPECAPELFFNLFKKNRGDRMVRFLMGQWSYGDLAKVIVSMPKWAMIKQAFKP